MNHSSALTACLLAALWASPGQASDLAVASDPAPAAVSDTTTTRVGRRPLKLVPLRLASGLSLRGGYGATGIFELGLLAARSPRWTHTVQLALALPRHLTILNDPHWRSLLGIDLGLDTAYVISPWATLGPSLGLSLRYFSQDSWGAGEQLVPVVGVHLSTAILTARRWRLALDARTQVDLLRTRIVLDTEVLTPSLFEQRVALRLFFGKPPNRVEE